MLPMFGKRKLCVVVLMTKGEMVGGKVAYRICQMSEAEGRNLLNKRFAEVAPFFLSQGTSLKQNPVHVTHSHRGAQQQVALWRGGTAQKVNTFWINRVTYSFKNLYPVQSESDAHKRQRGDRLPKPGRRRTTRSPSPSMTN
jgi:hypothetical protein